MLAVHLDFGAIPCQLKRSFNFLPRLIEVRSKLKIKVEHMGFDLGYSDRSRFIVLLFIFCKTGPCHERVQGPQFGSGPSSVIGVNVATGRGLIEGVNLSYTTRGVRPPAFCGLRIF